MKWWDQMPWSSFSECWALSQLFHSSLPLSSKAFQKHQKAPYPIRIIPNADKNVEQQELSFIADGSTKWYRQFGGQSGSFYKTKCIDSIWSSNQSHLVYTPKSWKLMSAQKNCTWMFISSFIHLPKLEYNQDVLQFIDKLWDIQIKEYYPALKSKWAIKPWKAMEET